MNSTRRASAVLVVAVAAWAIYWYVIAPYRANLTKRQVVETTNLALSMSDERHAAALAGVNLERLREVLVTQPWDAEAHVLVAASHRVLRQYPEAIEAYDQALHYEPTAYIFLNRGVTELAADRLEDARRSFAQAVRFDPTMAGETADAERTYLEMSGRP